jgi:hypothetical protein
VTFHTQATETLLFSASLVVVEACRRSFVFGEAGAKVGAVAAGAWFAELTCKVICWVENVAPLP